jgi:hypothetical protein
MPRDMHKYVMIKDDKSISGSGSRFDDDDDEKAYARSEQAGFSRLCCESNFKKHNPN